MEQRLLSQGILLYKTGKYTEALHFFQSLSAEQANDLDVIYFIGLCYMKLKRYEEALLYLEQIVTTIPRDEIQQDRILQCRLVLAVIYATTGRARLAEFELRSLKETGFNPCAVHAAMAYISWLQQDYTKSIEQYEKVLEMEPENITALNGLGYVLACLNKDLTRALMLSKRALDISPNSPACLDTLGWVYYKLGLLEEAENFLRKAQEKDETNEEILEHLKMIQASRENSASGGK